jgi:5-methylcytosine-specific restriction endonuclease McrA
MPRRHNRRPIRKKYTEPNKIPLAELWVRDGGICQWCRLPVELEKATRDHLKPKSHGGRNGHNFSNITLMCEDCNKLKGQQLIEYVA